MEESNSAAAGTSIVEQEAPDGRSANANHSGGHCYHYSNVRNRTNHFRAAEACSESPDAPSPRRPLSMGSACLRLSAHRTLDVLAQVPQYSVCPRACATSVEQCVQHFRSNQGWCEVPRSPGPHITLWLLHLEKMLGLHSLLLIQVMDEIHPALGQRLLRYVLGVAAKTFGDQSERRIVSSLLPQHSHRSSFPSQYCG